MYLHKEIKKTKHKKQIKVIRDGHRQGHGMNKN